MIEQIVYACEMCGRLHKNKSAAEKCEAGHAKELCVERCEYAFEGESFPQFIVMRGYKENKVNRGIEYRRYARISEV